jgi:RNA polymerase sigma-70 factor (ECF subfamily)
MTPEPTEPTSPAQAAPVSLQLMLCRHGPLLVEYVARHLPSWLASVVDPADVVQDVYLEAMRRSTEFQAADADYTRRWLMTIARNRLVDLMRHHGAAKRGGGRASVASGTPNASTVGLLEEVAVYDRTPSKSAAAHEIVALIHRSIADLPADYARVLRLRYLDGLSGKAVAAELSRTEGAVHVLCHRAVEALRLRLRSTLSLG